MGLERQEDLLSLAELADLFLFDLKLMDDGRHRKAAGMGTKNILANAEAFGKGPIPIWVRTPIIPGYTDDDDNIRAVSRFITEKMPAVVRYELLDVGVSTRSELMGALTGGD